MVGAIVGADVAVTASGATERGPEAVVEVSAGTVAAGDTAGAGGPAGSAEARFGTTVRCGTTATTMTFAAAAAPVLALIASAIIQAATLRGPISLLSNGDGHRRRGEWPYATRAERPDRFGAAGRCRAGLRYWCD